MSDVASESPQITDADELIEILSRRHDILRSLLDAPKERHVLVDHLDASKSTVYKGISQLRDLELIESTQVGLQPTLFGIVALRQYDEMARTAGLGDLLALLPPDAIDPSALVGAEVVTPDNHSVDRHLTRIETMLRNADMIRGFSPAVSPKYLSILHQRIIDGELSAKIIFTEEIMTNLQQEYPSETDDILSASDVTLWRTDMELPFTLLLVSSSDSTEVCLELGEEGHATGLVINDTAKSLRWAEAEYEHYKQMAVQVPG
ncbi:helix-turn-helix transcriptional regulator [Natrinema gelatinilyticum]|uniref:helix-turn-helix transcriptional regulator n=1 Tax=Natrinema gelatinilyticum TaxID=2961571 RepID=UPI0020C371B7|nr:hypothetical protein [Natrinema gelatinilyticum]